MAVRLAFLIHPLLDICSFHTHGRTPRFLWARRLILQRFFGLNDKGSLGFCYERGAVEVPVAAGVAQDEL